MPKPISEFTPQPAKDALLGKNPITPQVLSAAGAVSLDNPVTELTITGGSDIAITMPSGTDYQEKLIVMTSRGGAGNMVLTPTNLFTGTTMTFNTALDWVKLQWIAGKWHVLQNVGVTVA